jgi:hypothetical protein
MLLARSLYQADYKIWMPKLKYHIVAQITNAIKLNVGILTHRERMAFHDDRLVSLSVADGRLVASRSTAGSPQAGVPLLASGRLYWPDIAPVSAESRSLPQSTAPGRQVRVLAPATLEDDAPPLALSHPTTGSLRLAGGARRLVVCDGATITVFGTTAAD